jgi:hypothetical protein
VLLEEAWVGSLAGALDRFAALRIDHDGVCRHAETFSRARHVTAMRGVLDDVLAAPAGTRW